MVAGSENNPKNIIGSVQSSVISAANLLDFYEVEDGAATGVVLNHKSCYLVKQLFFFNTGVLPCRL